jgi:hypothetical protein
VVGEGEDVFVEIVVRERGVDEILAGTEEVLAVFV